MRALDRGEAQPAQAPFRLLIPEKGVSALDAPGQPFFDAEADAALFDELESAVVAAPGRSIVRLPYHINDPSFAQALVENFLSFSRRSRRTNAVDSWPFLRS